MPLIRKAASLNDKATKILMSKIKSGNALRTSSEEDYILDIFRREKESVARRLTGVNVISLTILIVVGSWTLFGLVLPGKKK
jgi:hypothetical protein